jgi:Ubiquitin-2 like Rad60 SUMO-like
MGDEDVAAATTNPVPPATVPRTNDTSTNTTTRTPPKEDEKPVKDDDTVPEDSEAAAPRDAANNINNVKKKMLNLRFLFANRDGLSVSIQCDPADTVGEVKGALISVWPKGTWIFCDSFETIMMMDSLIFQLFVSISFPLLEMPTCSDGDDLRLICMGKGLLTPDSRTLADLEIPSFKSHATPVNVSVRRPEPMALTKQQQQQSQHQQQQAMSLANGNNPNSGVVGNGALVASMCCIIQ